MGKVRKFIPKTVSLNKSELFTTSFSFKKADGGHLTDIIADIGIVTSLQKITSQHTMLSTITTHKSLASISF